MTLLMGQIESVNKSSALLILCYTYDWWCLLQHVAAENMGIYKPILVKPMEDSIKFAKKKMSKSKKQEKKYTWRNANILASPNCSNTKQTRGNNHHVTIPERFLHGHTTLFGYHNMPSASQIWPKLVGEYKTQINKKARSLPGRRHFFLFPLNIRWIPGKFTRTCKKKIIIKKIKNRD